MELTIQLKILSIEVVFNSKVAMNQNMMKGLSFGLSAEP